MFVLSLAILLTILLTNKKNAMLTKNVYFVLNFANLTETQYILVYEALCKNLDANFVRKSDHLQSVIEENKKKNINTKVKIVYIEKPLRDSTTMVFCRNSKNQTYLTYDLSEYKVISFCKP